MTGDIHAARRAAYAAHRDTRVAALRTGDDREEAERKATQAAMESWDRVIAQTREDDDE